MHRRCGTLGAMDGALGLDGCKAGWIGVVLSGGFQPQAVFGRTIDSVVLAAQKLSPIAVTAIDIPIGIPEAGPRQADVLARAMLAGRASSVFSTPIRAALEAATFTEALASSVALTQKGLSQQSYALRTKILEIDAYLARATTQVIEVHPEVVFAQMNGSPVPWSKKTWAGHQRRRALLAENGITLSGELGTAGAYAATDDLLDAAAAAWIAQLHVEGRTRSLPHPAEPMSNGGTGAIWIQAEL
jgi:predicted RNase H-like nuclease